VITVPALNKLIVGILLAGFLLLSTEIRFEHRNVLATKWEPWIPVVYTLVAAVLGFAGLFFWKKGGRKFLMFIFAAAMVVGMLGTWFHSKGKPLTIIPQVVSVWMLKPGTTMSQAVENSPPVLAPSAFIGLGLLGLVACWKKRT
jgi:hypothetical protein